jgi:Protein of unknown function (DUF4012)
VTATVHHLVAVAVSFAATALLAVLRRRPLPAPSSLPLVIAVAAAAAAVFTADTAATASTVADAAWRASLAGVATLAAAAAPLSLLIVAAALVAGSWSGAGALGAAVALWASKAAWATAPVRALLGAAISLGTLHVDWPVGSTAQAACGAAAVLLLIASWTPVRWPLAVAGGVAAFFSTLAGLAAADARGDLEAGVRDVRIGLTSVGRGDAQPAAAALDHAAERFRDAGNRMDAWWVQPARVVPVVGRQWKALSAVAHTGEEVTTTGARLVAAADPARLTAAVGQVPIEAVAALHDPADEAGAVLAQARRRLARADSPWLLPQADDRLDDLAERVVAAQGQAASMRDAAQVAPALLGADGPRRYLLAVQTPSELRGSGGFIGNYAEVIADRGTLSLGRTGRTNDLNLAGRAAAKTIHGPPDYVSRYSRFEPARLWQNVTVSPDFPTVAQVIADLYPQSGGAPIDGVIAVDPAGLGAVLKAIGPVTVADWPEPIGADNAERVLLFEQYARLKGDDRHDFLDHVTDAVWRRLTSRSVPLPDLAQALGPAVSGKHVMLAATRPGEQAALQRLGVSGAMPPPAPGEDSLAVVAQNGGGSKIDWFLRRHVEVGVSVKDGRVQQGVAISLRNEAPAAGLPSYIIGNILTPPLPSGTSKLYLSVYTPWGLDEALLDGEPLTMESEEELGRNVYSAFLAIPPGQTVTVHLRLQGELPADLDAYRLTLFRQNTVVPDDYLVEVNDHGRAQGRLTADRRLVFPLD